MFRAIIADDEETIRNGLKGLVESSNLGIKVIATPENGVEALEAVKTYRPEIILMDINMPLMDGLQSIEKIRELDQTARIIIISGYGEFEYAQQAMSLGVEAYLLKPIDYKNFTKILSKALDSYSKRIWEINQLQENLPDKSCKDTAVAALEYLREHFTNSEISLGSVAEQFHISQSYLTKIIKQKTGNTFSNYINDLRIHLAKTLLSDCEKNYNINEISELCGYSSQHYFSRAFKSSTGISPLKFRALQEKGKRLF